ncbi:MAG: type II toxin-antitoxin system HicB family antitoxin [Chloroflexi bacterium]|nr:type II toxin-antitoxin system HicB family antitoxin [Chloroflexota bacterium]
MRLLRYKILLRKEPEGGYTAIVPSLPGCVTYGDTVEEAKEMAKQAIELYIESLKEHGEEIPTEEETLEYTLTVEPYRSEATMNCLREWEERGDDYRAMSLSDIGKGGFSVNF